MWPIGVKIAFDLGLIIAGTGIAKKGKDKMMEDIYDLKEQVIPEENIFEVNDFEINEF